jgi:PAS domain S-box-containing protein
MRLQFEAVANLLPEAMLLVDMDGVIQAHNAAARRQLDQLDIELGQTVLADLCLEPPQQVEEYLRNCRRVTALTPATLTFRLPGVAALPLRAHGARFALAGQLASCGVLLRLIPKQAAESRFLAMNRQIEKLAHEVDLRRRAELDLIEQREWFRVTLAGIGDGVIVTDVHGFISFLNPVAESQTGWHRADALGQPIETVFRIVDEATRTAVESPVRRVLAEGIIVGLANHTILIRKDNSELHIDDSGAPIRDAEGKLIGVVLVFHDITERWRLEQQVRARKLELEDEHRRKDEFLAMLGHELRNPMSAIKTALELQQIPNATGSMLDRAGGVLRRQVAHLTRLVDELLDMSRIASGKINLHREVLDISVVIHSALELVEPMLHEKRHALVTELAAGNLWVNGDRHRLIQVVGNLLNNAAKYTPHGGTIHLATKRIDDAVEVSVRDNGMGIPLALLPRVFDIFTQSERTLARSEGGLGVGLTVVHRLVEQHSGTVAAHSDGPGTGSEFRIRLPLVHAVSAQPSTPLSSPVIPGRRKILVVDDNQDAAIMVAELLRVFGNEVSIAFDGQEAISFVDQELPSIVLLDIGLPGMDGYTVARTLRANTSLRNFILIALTGYGQPEDIRKSHEAGFDHHLTKPLDIGKLLEILAEIPETQVLD